MHKKDEDQRMDTKRVALVAIFAALAIVLNPNVSRISIPSPFLLLPYQLWEIPTFVAFLVIGPKPGILIALISSAGMLAFNQNIVAIGGVIALFAMLGGFYLAYKLITRNVTPEKTPSTRKTLLATTASAVVFRTVVMAAQNYYTVTLMTGLPQSAVISMMPLVALFNITEPLYVIPVSYLIAKTISSNLKVGNKIP